jgi:hypothetical protein
MTTPDRREWRALLKAELARRTARVEWQAGEDERARQQFLDTLQAMAERFAASAHRYPLDVSDMSPAEQLCCHLLPEDLRPAGLPSEVAIWAKLKARTQG